MSDSTPEVPVTMTERHIEWLEREAGIHPDDEALEIGAFLRSAVSGSRVSVPREELEKIRVLAEEVFRHGKWSNGGMILDIADRWLTHPTSEEVSKNAKG